MSNTDDPYIQGNGVLKNKLGVTSEVALDKIEATKTYARLHLISKKGPKGPFSYDRLKATHRYIFQDIYEWAGQPRTISISKGDSNFTPSYLVQHKMENLFTRLEKDHFLQNLKPKEFAGKITEFFADLNQIHPFREGNGRMQRAFTEALAKQAGYDLAFDISTKERMIDISIKSHQGDLSGMNRLFKEMIDPERVTMMRKALGFLSKTHIPWNDIYIATTEVGQTYKGRFVGQGGSDFMMRTEDNQIVIGNIKELDKVPKSGEIISLTAKQVTEFQKSYFLTDGKNNIKGEQPLEPKRRR